MVPRVTRNQTENSLQPFNGDFCRRPRQKTDGKYPVKLEQIIQLELHIKQTGHISHEKAAIPDVFSSIKLTEGGPHHPTNTDKNRREAKRPPQHWQSSCYQVRKVMQVVFTHKRYSSISNVHMTSTLSTLDISYKAWPDVQSHQINPICYFR